MFATIFYSTWASGFRFLCVHVHSHTFSRLDGIQSLTEEANKVGPFFQMQSGEDLYDVARSTIAENRQATVARSLCLCRQPKHVRWPQFRSNLDTVHNLDPQPTLLSWTQSCRSYHLRRLTWQPNQQVLWVEADGVETYWGMCPV